MAVIDGLEQPEGRLDAGAEPALVDRPDKLPAGPAGDQADEPEPVERQKLVGEQANDRAGVVAPRDAWSASETRDRPPVRARTPSGSPSIRRFDGPTRSASPAGPEPIGPVSSPGIEQDDQQDRQREQGPGR